jgi:hypothetical protein
MSFCVLTLLLSARTEVLVPLEYLDDSLLWFKKTLIRSS